MTSMRSGGREPSQFRNSFSRTPEAAQLDEHGVKSAYRRWAPFYDHTFGRFTTEGRRHAVEIINRRNGRVLEVGVGTGLSLPNYGSHLEIVGIDLSPEMLEKAREKVTVPAGEFDAVRVGARVEHAPCRVDDTLVLPTFRLLLDAS